VKILLVDDHAVVREGVRQLISALPDTSVVEATDGEQALLCYRAHRPHIVILDLRLGAGRRGMEVLDRLLEFDKQARVVIFSFLGDVMIVASALRQGARGFVTKGAGADELLNAVRAVAAGQSYIESDIAKQLAFTADLTHPLNDLTRREHQILSLLGEGKSLTEIADVMAISTKTVSNSFSILKQKLGLERTADLIRTALTLGG
jgi:DNA-binding NarL/FixJ family response regulator